MLLGYILIKKDIKSNDRQYNNGRVLNNPEYGLKGQSWAMFVLVQEAPA